MTDESVRLFWKKVDKTDTCWLWTGHTVRGYGRLCRQGKGLIAHRIAYELEVGPIPDGMQIDHLCRVKACVNPAHLEPVTNAENMRRRALARTHCNRGHEFTPENIYTSPSTGDRTCLKCKLASASRAYRRSKARLAVNV